MRAKSVIALGAAGAAGALFSHLLDPDRGRARRARLQDQVVAAARRRARSMTRTARRRARYTAGRLEGAGHRAMGRLPTHGQEKPLSDAMLVDKVRSEVLGRGEFAAFPINVDACEGLVHLRGEVPTGDLASRLVDAVAHVPGVAGVESLLHQPGEPAPNKAAALGTARP
jgi:osmotically-inducible protein OsmY